jgi:galactokinase
MKSGKRRLVVEIPKEELVERFREVFGEGGDEIRVFFAPGRINLIGEHTDYNGGHVFPCALSRGTYAAVRLRKDRKLLMFSENKKHDGIRNSSIDDLTYRPEEGWISYIKGIYWAIDKRGINLMQGMDILITGNLPMQAGLSSSASLLIAMGLACARMYDLELTLMDIAVLAQRAESIFVGVPCGILDQFGSAMSRAGYGIFLSTDTMKYEYVPLKLKDMSIVCTNSQTKHDPSLPAYQQRRDECARAMRKLQTLTNVSTLGALSTDRFESYKDVIMDDVLVRRARHAVYENARTIRAVNAMRVGNLRRFGELLNSSHDSLRDNYEVTNREIDFLVDRARELPEVYGSRMTGGGFGGCTITLIKTEAIELFKAKITQDYVEAYRLVPTFYVVKSADGARELT